MEKIITDVSDFESIAETVIQQLQAKNNNTASVLALHGELGAGKTTFTQILAKKLGVQEQITSPTFVVMKQYSLQEQVFTTLIHIDAYRIEDIDEMRILKFDNLCTQKHTLICIEWAERIAPLLPEGTIHMNIEIEGDTRIITLNG